MRARRPQHQRLEKCESGKPLRFWEATRSGTELTLRYGVRSSGREIVKQFPNEAQAQQAFLTLVAEKRAAGYADPVVLEQAGAHATRGKVARNPELEALIEAAPNDPQGYRIYADWLQQQGDVRGELMSVQSGLAEDPTSISLNRAETELFKRFRAQLLGPLERYRVVHTSRQSFKGLAWHFGFIRAARLRRISHTPLAEIVRALLEHASARFLQHLVLGTASYGGDLVSHAPALKELGRLAPTTLRSLVVGDQARPDLEDALPSLPLERLVLVGDPTITAGPAPASLRELHLAQITDTALSGLANVDWPGVRRLSIAPSGLSSGNASGLRRLLVHMPQVKHLTLHHHVSGATADWLVDAIVPKLPTGLEQLDLDVDAVSVTTLEDHAEPLASLRCVRLLETDELRLQTNYRARLPYMNWEEAFPDDAAVEIG